MATKKKEVEKDVGNADRVKHAQQEMDQAMGKGEEHDAEDGATVVRTGQDVILRANTTKIKSHGGSEESEERHQLGVHCRRYFDFEVVAAIAGGLGHVDGHFSLVPAEFVGGRGVS